MDAIEAMRVGLGPGVLMSYILQGLFHPSRRVREVYWRMYSKSSASSLSLFTALTDLVTRFIDSLYLGSQDAMVPFYPNLAEFSDERNMYERHALYSWI